ncbi:MAG: nitronate monooxygenase [Sphingomonadaceae bacterium]|nr:nitronate monooxygenase [Sphingomonadaceae bacterium]
MSFASSVPLAVACCGSGVIGGWQGGRVTGLDAFARYLDALRDLGGAPPIVNLPARILTDPDGEAKLALLERARAPLVLSSIGDPAMLVGRVHEWGGRIIQDVTTLRHAEKSIAAGVDGLMATCAGAGGHTGFLSPFAFVPAMRRIWDGLLIVGGGIADASGMAAALALGGDIACMGTRFIATPESAVAEEHRTMIAGASVDGIIASAAMNGVAASWLHASLVAVGLDPAALPAHRIEMPEGVRPWRDVYSAGHSAGLIGSAEPVTDLIARLTAAFDALVPPERWRARLAAIDEGWQVK